MRSGCDRAKMVIIKKRVGGLNEASLARFVRQAARAVGLRGSVDVLVTNDRDMKTLNLRFRGMNTPTDVLSFSPLSGLPTDFAGDIAISADMAARNATRLEHSAEQETKILVLHGLMHLAGYDHESDDGSMARKEQRLRRSLHLPAGLIERSGKRMVRADERPRKQVKNRTRVEGRSRAAASQRHAQ